MKLERRNGTGEPASPAPEETPSSGSGEKKPVIVYIFVLFTVALLLMIWSLFSHQRSNTEAIGRLQGSVSAMQEVQELQERVITLQEALDDAQAEADLQTRRATETQELYDRLLRQTDALYYLYALQQQYLLRDFEDCRETIRTMEDGDMVKLLPDGGGAVDVTSPALRYRELKEAVEALGG